MVVVGACGRELLEWIPGSVDLLLANEQEARMLTEIVTGAPAEGEVELACAAVAELAPTVVVKLGAAGSLVWERGTIAVRAPGVQAQAVDTTGAGDSFAAGYLYALLAGGGAADAASLGNRVAASIVEVEGCDYSAVSAGISF
jgi:sugar/nucleoside kinase (ribokinase family)